MGINQVYEGPTKTPQEKSKEKEQSDKGKDKDTKEMSEKGPDKSGDRGQGLSGLGVLELCTLKAADSDCDVSFSVSAERHVFLAILKDRDKGEIEEALVRAHLTHLSKLMAEGRLGPAGAFARGGRRLQILIAETREEAEQIVTSDPLLLAGCYKGFDLDEIVTL
jgi:uncharacterized protein YciI